MGCDTLAGEAASLRSGRGTGARVGLTGSRVDSRVARLTVARASPRIPSLALSRYDCRGNDFPRAPFYAKRGNEEMIWSCKPGKSAAHPSPVPFRRFADAKPRGSAPWAPPYEIRFARGGERGMLRLRLKHCGRGSGSREGSPSFVYLKGNRLLHVRASGSRIHSRVPRPSTPELRKKCSARSGELNGPPNILREARTGRQIRLRS